MTDTETAPAGRFTPDFSDYLAKEAARNRLAEELRPTNKAALFDALEAAGIVTVVVTFDGYGDSGQVESVDAHDTHGEVALPEVEIELASPTCDGIEIDRRTLGVADAIEQLAYDFLEETHGGWEDNEGAYGEFTFDIAERVIRLDYNERVLNSEYTGHEF